MGAGQSNNAGSPQMPDWVVYGVIAWSLLCFGIAALIIYAVATICCDQCSIGPNRPATIRLRINHKQGSQARRKDPDYEQPIQTAAERISKLKDELQKKSITVVQDETDTEDNFNDTVTMTAV